MLERRTPLDLQVKLFLLDCNARRLTDQTIEWYTQKLGVLSRWCLVEGVDGVPEITHHHLRSFMADMSKRKYSSQYQHNIARATRAFLNFCVLEELIEESPFAKLHMPKLAQHDIVAFSAEEIKRIQRACDTERDKAITLFLLDSGVRLAEMVALNYGDIDIESGEVHVRQGKGQKDRVTYLGSRSRRQLFRYLSERSPAPRPGSALWVALRRPHHRLTHDGIVILMRRLRNATGIPHLTCHTFRRTFALNCLLNGMNIYALARLMGHADIKMLIKYLALVENDLAAAHGKYSPVDNL